MFGQVLRVQWHYARPSVVVFAVLTFVAPLATVYYGGQLDQARVQEVTRWLAAAEQIGRAIPVLALFVGVVLGTATWAPDHAGGHVYALALPLARPRFVVLRFGAGLVLLAAPVAALALGAMIATLAVNLPAGIHAYPVQLAVRFALAVVTCFALFFAISIATRRAVLLVLGLIGGILLADITIRAFGGESQLVTQTLDVLTSWPGPLSILTGRWALFDV